MRRIVFSSRDAREVGLRGGGAAASWSEQRQRQAVLSDCKLAVALPTYIIQTQTGLV